MKGSTPVLSLVLAGGAGRRMGGDKPFRRLLGRPLIDWALRAARAQGGQVAIAANDAPARFAPWGVAVLPDCPQPGLGPLGGVLAGLTRVAVLAPQGGWLWVQPVDVPVIPSATAARLIARATNAGVPAAHIRAEGRDHYLCSVWHSDLRPAVAAALAAEARAVGRLLRDQGACAVDPGITLPGAFFNVNDAAALATLAARLADDHL